MIRGVATLMDHMLAVESPIAHHLRAVVLLARALSRVLVRVLHGDEPTLVLTVRV